MLREFLIIILFNYIGVTISNLFSLPIPGTILALILFFLFLYTKTLTLEKVERVSNFLLENMTLFFLPPAINLIAVQDKVEGKILKIILLMVLTTFLTMGITGKIVQFLIEKKEKKDDGEYYK